jgi:hypothetical protein
MAELAEARRFQPSPREFELTILAQDPSVTDPFAKDPSRSILRAKVRVPARTLRPGPRGPRFHLVDYDPTTHTLFPPYELSDGSGAVRDRFKDATDDEVRSDHRFHAQNVYVIASRTLGAFEAALGRRIPWAFGSHQLYLVPHAFQEANAYYSDTDQALLFGDYEPASGTTFTCLSHDIVAHETTHAILDGLRRRFDVPGLPDQLAFHEGFADVVALLSVFSMTEVVNRLLFLGTRDTLTRADVSIDALKELSLAKIGEELGDALGERGQGLRNSTRQDPTEAWKDAGNLEWEEPHRRGEIFVAVVMQALLQIWSNRLDGLIQANRLNRARAAEEGSKSASHLLSMLIRAIDYCPPVDFEFADFLDATLLSDQEVAPDDEHDYRQTVIDSFAAFGIRPRAWPQVPSVIAVDSFTYRDFNYVALRSEPEEVYRFLWENAEVLGIDQRFYLKVEDVVPSTRIGPDGFIVSESVTDYVQQLEATFADALALSPGDFAPIRLPPETPVKFWGGGTIISDQFGRVKYHLTKRLDDWPRQARRLGYLVRRGIRDGSGRYGFAYGTPSGMRFANLHRPDDQAGESW